LFQLYCAAVPFRVRQAEGMTLHEWRWTDGWGVRSAGVGAFVRGSRTDYIVDGPSRPAAWLQVDRKRRRLALLADPHGDIDVDEIFRFGMSRLGAGGGALCAVRDYQPAIATAIEAAGFLAVQHESLFA